MKITIDDISIDTEEKLSYRQLITKHRPEEAKRILGVAVGGKTLSLADAPTGGETVRTLRYEDSEGRRIYERSLRFVMLMAVRMLYPDCKMRVENAAGRGVYARIVGIQATPEITREIRRKMREIVDKDLPFEKLSVSRAEAIALFEREGKMDKVRLLTYRPFDYFRLYSCAGMVDYFYGEMAPSTGYVNVFDLKFYMPGVVLMLPDRLDSTKPTVFVDQPKLMATYAESARWSEILGCTNVSDLNEMIKARMLREFIRVNEALHEKSISQIAENIRKSNARLILIAGPSSSGKTTFTHRLSIALRALGLRPLKLSLDDYYLDRDKIPVDENGKKDFERIDTLDLELFNEHLVDLLQGAPIDAPNFNFVEGRRMDTRHRVQADPDQPILVEGIHGLNERLTGDVPRDLKYKIYISALTMLNLDDTNRIRTTDARLLRRLVRDNLFRGTGPEVTLSMWSSVRRGEELYIFPYQEQADVMFNSTLVYELAILKRYAYPLLQQISADCPDYTLARRLIKFLNYIQTAEVEDEIPINSILREFIGGCCFYREKD